MNYVASSGGLWMKFRNLFQTKLSRNKFIRGRWSLLKRSHATSSKRDDRFMRALADGQWLQSLSRVFVSAIHRNASRSDPRCLHVRSRVPRWFDDDVSQTCLRLRPHISPHGSPNRYFPTKFECVLMSRNVGPYRTWVTSRTVQF